VSKLELRGVEKRFGDTVAVDGVNLALDEGEFVSLLGPSGCGKTTTLRMIAGFIHPTAGTIEMDGKVLSSPSGSVPPERRQMSMIFQSYAVWPNMTVEQNVAFGLKLRRLPGGELRKRVAEMLDVVQMGHLAQRYPAELSGGQQQRVALARAIVIKPSVLLLDEPLSNLDANLREEMRFEIRRLHEEFRITTVYVTHDQSEAMVTSDRIAVMNQGRIEQVDDPHTLYTKPKTRFVAGFIGRTNFIEGAANGSEIVFDRFSVSKSALENGAALAGKVTFSVRPQSLRLSRMPSQRGGERPQVEVKVIERAYLGEYWDYIVTPAQGSTRLRVTAPPLEVYGVGESAWLELDPTQMAPIV
jgi:ABC-type Fe3+/spermidine/putrescine transport system ATPase subunit